MTGESYFVWWPNVLLQVAIGRITNYLPGDAQKRRIHWFFHRQITVIGFYMDFLSQRVQNTAARFVTGTSKYHHMTPILRHLHWLQVEGRVQFKIILVFWKSLHGCAPVYLTSLINVHCLARNLRSSSLSLLELPCRPRNVPFFYGKCSFAHAMPKCWNSLSESI